MSSNFMSILIEKGGLSFLVTKENQIIENGFTTFESNLSLEDGLNKIFNDNLYLKQAYQSVYISYVCRNFALVPKSYFKKDNDCEKWLGFDSEIEENSTLEKIELKNKEVVLVYSIPLEIIQFVKSNFNTSKITHTGELFLNQINLESDKPQAFINFHHTEFEIIIYQNEKLQLYNIFDYETKEDILYHLLNIFEQLHINSNLVELYYYGDLEDSTLKMMMNFIRHVIPATTDLQKMKHYTLIENLQQNL